MGDREATRAVEGINRFLEMGEIGDPEADLRRVHTVARRAVGDAVDARHVQMERAGLVATSRVTSRESGGAFLAVELLREGVVKVATEVELARPGAPPMPEAEIRAGVERGLDRLLDGEAAGRRDDGIR